MTSLGACAPKLRGSLHDRGHRPLAEHVSTALQVAPNGALAVGAISDPPQLLAFDLTELRLGTHSLRGRTVPIEGRPRDVAFDPAGRWFVVSDDVTGQLLVFDTSDFALARAMMLRPGVFGISLCSVRSLAFVANVQGECIHVVPLGGSGSVQSITRIGMPRQALRMTRDGRTLYAASYEHGAVYRVDVAALQVTLEMSGFPGVRGMALLADDRYLVVASSGADMLVISDLVRGTAPIAIPCPGHPFGVVAANGPGTVLVSRRDSNDVVRLDVTRGTVSEPVARVQAPRQGIAIHPSGAVLVLGSDGTLVVATA